MTLSPAEMNSISEMSDLLYDFLPGNPHPFARQDLSFGGAAQEVGLGQFWMGGSKRPAIAGLLEDTLNHDRGKFTKLILAIVSKAMVYRRNQRNPITREEIEQLNGLILKVKFKIPDLWNETFLKDLPSSSPAEVDDETLADDTLDAEQLRQLTDKLIEITELTPQERGFAFESLLNDLFMVFGLEPRKSFRLVGEQIDGSFQLGDNTYLVEAKWHANPIGQRDILAFRGIVESKAKWTRGLFVSFGGFTEDGLDALLRGKDVNVIGMDSQDIYFVLEGNIPLDTLIARKARRAAETGEFFVSAFELIRGI